MNLKIAADFQSTFVIEISDPSPNQFAQALTKHLAQAPAMFEFATVILAPHDLVDLPYFIQQCRDQRLIPVGVRVDLLDDQSLAQQLADQAQAQGLRIYPPSRHQSRAEKRHGQTEQWGFQFVTRPVRSGQTIYAQEKHLVVMSQVSAGAEIMADGDIHVYGPLRGRALAGVRGRESSRIISQNLDAELLSVAGVYQVRDDMPQLQGAAQVRLQDEQLIFEHLNAD